MWETLWSPVYFSEMDYFHGNSRTRRRRIKARVQQHLMTLAMEAVDQAVLEVDQADQSVDQAVQPVDQEVQVEEYMENNGDETVNLQLDFDSDVDDLNIWSDCDEDPACDFTEEEPHSDAKRKLAEWAANGQVSDSALSELLAILWELGLDVPKDPRTILGTVKDYEPIISRSDPKPVSCLKQQQEREGERRQPQRARTQSGQ